MKIMELSIVLVAIILLGVLWIFLISKRSQKLSRSDYSLVCKEWESVSKRVEYDARHAVLEADKLVDFVLKRKGYEGQMSDKLRKAEGTFSNANALWSAHKLRNKIAHEIGFEVSNKDAKHALSAFKQALWDLGLRL